MNNIREKIVLTHLMQIIASNVCYEFIYTLCGEHAEAADCRYKIENILFEAFQSIDCMWDVVNLKKFLVLNYPNYISAIDCYAESRFRYLDNSTHIICHHGYIDDECPAGCNLVADIMDGVIK